MELRDAIELSKIICKAKDDRLPLILSILKQSDIQIDALWGIEEWGGYKSAMAVTVKQPTSEFLADLVQEFEGSKKGDVLQIPTADFAKFCKARRIKSSEAQRLLAICGRLEKQQGGTGYTKICKIDGKAVRCVVVMVKMNMEEEGEA